MMANAKNTEGVYESCPDEDQYDKINGERGGLWQLGHRRDRRLTTFQWS
jgi:hypothetical protein